MNPDLVPLLATRRQFLAGAMGASVCSAAGCGTLLYPERRGQPSGQLDWGIVMLDGIGLILFFVPGVIAFAVDFATGAIYLPPREEFQLSSAKRPVSLRRVTMKTRPLTSADVAGAVTAEIGQTVTLEDGTYVTAELSGLDHFWTERDRLAATVAETS